MKNSAWILLLLSGCASNYEVDRATTPRPVDTGQPSLSNQVYRDPISGVILGGIGLASNPNYFKTHTISGRCTLVPKSKQGIVEIPCKDNVEISLHSSDGKEQAKMTLRQGEFAFTVKPNEHYSIAVKALGYKVQNRNLNHLMLGDQLVLRLSKEN